MKYSLSGGIQSFTEVIITGILYIVSEHHTRAKLRTQYLLRSNFLRVRPQRQHKQSYPKNSPLTSVSHGLPVCQTCSMSDLARSICAYD